MTIGRRAANAQFRVALLPWMVAGVRTQFENLQRLPVPDDMLVDVYPIVPFRENGLIERLPFLQASQKGTLRSTLHALPVLRSRYDAIWTQTLLPMVPAMAVHAALRERYPAIIYTIDTTPALMDELTTLYYGRPQPGPRKRRLRDALFRYGLERCTLVTPWSRWAARSFAGQYGVPEDRIRVIPPGIDIIAWSVAARDAATDRPLRLLFVGADFERKGGLLLLDVYRRHLRGRCELHMVTRDRVPEEPGVRVYAGFGPNDEGLRALYARCDALVLPTRADCFSLAALEAMASGLPVIICPMGGIPRSSSTVRRASWCHRTTGPRCWQRSRCCWQTERKLSAWARQDELWWRRGSTTPYNRGCSSTCSAVSARHGKRKSGCESLGDRRDKAARRAGYNASKSVGSCRQVCRS